MGWTDSGSNVYITGGNVGISTTSPSYPLDISDGSVAVVVGADNGATSRTNSTTKIARIGVPHYTNSEEPLGAIVAVSGSSENLVHIGGGSGSFNAATAVSIYTGANTTTTEGTERMRVTSAGNVGIGSTAPNLGSHSGRVVTVESSSKENALELSARTDSLADHDVVGSVDFRAGASTNRKVAQVRAHIEGTSEDSAHLYFSTASGGTLIDRALIKSNGSFELGPFETVPTFLYDSGDDKFSVRSMFLEDPGDAVDLIMRRAGGSASTRSALGANTTIGKLYWTPWGDNASFGPGDGVAAIYARTGSVAPTSSSRPGELRIGTTPTGSTSPVDRVIFEENGNIGFDSNPSYGGGVKVFFLANCSTVPSSDPSGGGVLYVENGTLKYRGSSGTVTTVGPA